MSWTLLPRRPKPYRRKDFLDRERYRPDYRALAAELMRAVEFESVLDVGCANGFLLSEFLAAGRRVRGIELSPAVSEVLPAELLEAVRIGDFTAAGGVWDLVCCVEVAEHIPPERSEELVATLVRCARRAIYFTAAPPGQAGRGHINCREHAEWLAWFDGLGWVRDPGRTADLRAALSGLESAPWLATNSILLVPGGAAPISAGG